MRKSGRHKNHQLTKPIVTREMQRGKNTSIERELIFVQILKFFLP